MNRGLYGLPDGFPGDIKPPVMVRLRLGASVSILNVTQTTVNWDTVDYDPYASFPYLSVDRLTARVSGQYRVWCTALWATTGTGTRTITAALNGLASVTANRITRATVSGDGAASPPGNIAANLYFTIYLNAGDYISFSVYQNSGSSVNLIGAALGSATPEATQCGMELIS